VEGAREKHVNEAVMLVKENPFSLRDVTPFAFGVTKKVVDNFCYVTNNRRYRMQFKKDSPISYWVEQVFLRAKFSLGEV
jgi:hypothetical protein